MKKNTKKKIRDIRNAFVMTCVMVAMLSTASYAWFSLTDSPTVAGLQMTAAASSGGLQVSNESSANFFDAIQIADTEVKTLKPVTPDTTQLGVFQEGVYTGNVVTGLSTLSSIDGYVAKYTYYLKSTAPESTTEKIDIGILCGNIDQTAEMSVSDAHVPSLAGSLVRKSPTADGGASEIAAYAVRVGLVATDVSTSTVLTPQMIIWEPNADGEANNVSSVTFAENQSGVEDDLGDAETLISEMSGNVTKGGTNTTSDSLFQMLKGSTAQIDMYIWLEGTDTLCVDQIQADDLEAQIQFTVVGGATEEETP